jgi:PAS domain S-box-containing protein
MSLRFTVFLVLVVLATLGAAACMLYRFEERAVERRAFHRAQTVLSFGQACREYAREVLSPAVRAHSDRLVFEANSATFVARGTFEKLNKQLPEYTFREAALNPLNLSNAADATDAVLIGRFARDRSLEEFSGFRTRDGHEEFFVARPIAVQAKCLECHDSPDTAPVEVVERYGREHGFGWKEGDIAGAMLVSVPVADLRAEQSALLWFVVLASGGLAAVLLALIPLLFDRLVGRRLRRANATIQEVRATGDLSLRIGDASRDEFGDVARAFDSLAAELAVEKEKVREHTAGLEHLVQERTRDLESALTSVRRLVRGAEFAGEAMMVTDRKGAIVWTNAAFTVITGYESAEAIGRTPRILNSGEVAADVFRSMWGEIASGRTWHGRLVNRRKNGALFHASVTIAPILRGDGAIEGFVSVESDVTEEVERERERERLQEEVLGKARLLETQNHELARARESAVATSRATADFLSTMSHEIRTPMNGVLGFVQLLLDTDLTLEQLDWLKTIRASGETLLTIVNDILDFSKAEAGRLELESVPVDLADLARGVVALFAPRAREKGLSLSASVAHEAEGRWLCDPVRVRQILTNLVGNALKFTQQGSIEVAIGARDGAPGILLRVRDTGIGIAPEHQAHLFQPFAQADKSTTRRFGGTGLGLAIVKKLVERMGGTVELQSESGRGATFSIVLPLERAASAEEPVPALPSALVPATVEPGATRPARLLLVDDNLVNQKVALAMLRKLGYAAEVAGDGKAALEAVQRTAYDLVFMDGEMPEMDGLEAARRIREREDAGPHVPIVAMTARAMDGDRERCLAAGMDDYITKPIRFEDLRRVLATFLAAARP